MDEAALAIVRIRVERADEELRAVRRLIEDGLYRIACARATAAAFVRSAARVSLPIIHLLRLHGFRQFLGQPHVDQSFGGYTLLARTGRQFLG